jgi:thiamine-monophosphate kinase
MPRAPQLPGRKSRRRSRTIGEIGEFGFLAELLPTLRSGNPAIRVGIGDDCAVVDRPESPLVLTTDTLVDQIHFRRDWLADRQLGRRAFLVNASDIASMGGRSLWCLASLGAPADHPERALLDVMQGIADAAREVGTTVVGGNLSRSPVFFATVALVGTVGGEPLTRGGARAGDRVFVSGTLGGAAFAVREWLAGRRPGTRSQALRAFAEPPARTVLGPRLAATGAVSAMIDVSDGFAQDLGHVLAASGVGAGIDVERLPVCPGLRLPQAERLALAASGGEDYELLFTVRPSQAARVRAVGRALGVPLTDVGVVTADAGVRACDPRWQPLLDAARGHDHFRETPKRRSRPRAAS